MNNKIENHKEALLYAKFHQEESNLAQCYIYD